MQEQRAVEQVGSFNKVTFHAMGKNCFFWGNLSTIGKSMDFLTFNPFVGELFLLNSKGFWLLIMKRRDSMTSITWLLLHFVGNVRPIGQFHTEVHDCTAKVMHITYIIVLYLYRVTMLGAQSFKPNPAIPRHLKNLAKWQENSAFQVEATIEVPPR